MEIRLYRTAIVFCIVLVAGLASAGASFGAPKLVAKVGNVPVTNYELARKFQRILPIQGNFHGGVSAERKAEIKQQALDELIEQAYKTQFAISEEISVDNSVVDERMAAFKKKFVSEEAYKTAVAAEGASELRASVYRSLLAQKAEEVHIKANVNVSDAEVKAYYDENKTRFMRPRRFKASHILIRVDPASNAEERKVLDAKAQDLLKRAKAGEDFYNLAYFNSDDRTKYVGGDLGYFHEGQTVKPFEQALLKLKPGDISDLVKTRYGYHIIKLITVDEPQQLSFDEMKSKIRSQLEKELQDSLYSTWLAELKTRYPVETY